MKSFKIDFTNWPNIFDLLNHYICPWDECEENWEGYNWDTGVLTVEMEHSELMKILEPVFITLEDYMGQMEDDLREKHMEEVESLREHLASLR